MNNVLHRIVLLRILHREPRTVAYFARRQAEGLTDRDFMRYLERHIANEMYTALRNPGTDNLVGQKLRDRRRHSGVPITGLAATLAVPYQQPRRLEIGTRTDPDPDVKHRATLALDQLGAV